MSKKLIYGGVEVTPNDPRLSEILASIVELVQRSMDEQSKSRYQCINRSWVQCGKEMLKPNGVVKIDGEFESSSNLEKQYINPDLFFAFIYEGTLHINKRGMSVAECIKEPGFKVVNEEE